MMAAAKSTASAARDSMTNAADASAAFGCPCRDGRSGAPRDEAGPLRDSRAEQARLVLRGLKSLLYSRPSTMAHLEASDPGRARGEWRARCSLALLGLCAFACGSAENPTSLVAPSGASQADPGSASATPL